MGDLEAVLNVVVEDAELLGEARELARRFGTPYWEDQVYRREEALKVSRAAVMEQARAGQ
jgi:hypothetical protein